MNLERSTSNPTSVLSARSIDSRYTESDRKILSQVSVTLSPGQLVSVVGPNGSGKSTLVRALSRTLEPASGVVLLDQADLYKAITAREAARSIGVVPQTTDVFLDFTVRDTIAMGRAPWRAARGMLAPDSALDIAAVDRAIDRMEIPAELAGRSIAHVSGGERQRALVARMLAQEAQIMLLDEPTASLDLAAQANLLEWLRSQAKHEARAVMIVLHDLNLAAAYSDRILVLNAGAVVAEGTPSDVLTPQIILDVYGVRAWIRSHPLTGRPTVWTISEAEPPVDAPALAGRRVHLYCGSGTGANFMFQLSKFGARVSASILQVDDVDAEAASSLGIAFASLQPFSQPSSTDMGAESILAADAEGAILTRVRIGQTNAAMIDSAIEFARAGRPLVVVQSDPVQVEFEQRIRAAGAVSFVSKDEDAILHLNATIKARSIT